MAGEQDPDVEIWHNPRCSKSRAAKAALDEAGIAYTERRYLDDPPTAEELVTVLDRLDLEPWDITRTGEPAAEELGLARTPRDAAHRQDWLDALVDHPQLIQRPIVAGPDGRAVVARDEESRAALGDWR